MMVNLKNLYKNMEGLDNVKDDFLENIDKCEKIIDKHYKKFNQNVISLDSKDAELFNDFILKEYFGRYSMIVKNRNEDYYTVDKYLLVLNPNFKQRFACFVHKNTSLITLLNLIFVLVMLVSTFSKNGTVITIYIPTWKIVATILNIICLIKVNSFSFEKFLIKNVNRDYY